MLDHDCLEGVNGHIPEGWQSCCDFMEQRLSACQFETRMQFYSNGDCGIVIPEDGSYLKINYCPSCGKKI